MALETVPRQLGRRQGMNKIAGCTRTVFVLHRSVFVERMNAEDEWKVLQGRAQMMVKAMLSISKSPILLIHTVVLVSIW